MIGFLPLGTTFLIYLAVVATTALIAFIGFVRVRTGALGVGVMVLWLGYAATLGYGGVVGNTNLPIPGIVLLLAPIILSIALVIGRSSVGRQLASQIPLSLLIGFQAFRIGVEFTLHRLWELGSVPKIMTFEGGNVEILIGFSAPLIALISTRGSGGRRIAFAWNVIGLVSLLNVATRAVLTAPGPLNLIHGETLNTALGTFPFTFIPGFMAPLAMMLHVLTFRAVRLQALSAHRDLIPAAAGRS
jgi:hypothetical protein